MLPPLNSETLSYAMIGAAGGAGYCALSYLWRDRDRLLHLWRYRHDPLAPEWVADESTYGINPPSAEERRRLPLQIAAGAALGAAGLVGFISHSDALMGLLLASIAIASTFRVLFASRAIIIDAEQVDAAPLDLRQRIAVVAPHMLMLGMTGFTMLALPGMESWREAIGLGGWRLVAVSLALGLIGVAIGQRDRIRALLNHPDNDGSYLSPYAVGRDDLLRSLAALGVAFVMIAVIIAFASSF